MSNGKPWERPWSMDEMVENSESWSLAGDVALLNTLKAFADNLLTKTTQINSNLQNLTNNLDETNLRLCLAQNEFQSLRNTQFIESRVYEDDESLPQTNESKKIPERDERDLSENVRLAALKGLEVLERYFDRVEVSVSDSEDDDIDIPNYILRPKDFYLQRPLPYVIGSSDWHKSYHVGLEDSSESETDKVSDKFSESDSDELPIVQDRSQIKETSDTSSELDFSQKSKKSDIFNSSENSSSNSIPVGPPVGKSFAEVLAAKLDNVITDLEPEVNKRPLQKPTNYDNLFFDEPPPLDEPKGLFSGGSGLFDDDDDDNRSIQKKGGDSSDDDDIFAGKPIQKKKIDLFAEAPPTMSKPIPISETPPTLDERKKPIGGVSIFGGGNLFEKKLLKRRVSSEEEEEEEPKKDLFDDSKKIQDGGSVKKNFDIDDVIKQEKIEPKKISLFDDDDDLFKDDLFSTNTTKKSFTSGLFDDISDEDLFAKEQKSEKFDDLVVSGQNSINSVANIESHVKPRLSLFDSPPPETDDLFKEADLFTKSTPTEEAPPSGRQATPPPIGESLFEAPPSNRMEQDTPPPLTRDLFSDTQATPPTLTKPLFEDAPPPDDRLFADDDWDTKSDLSDDEISTNQTQLGGAQRNLFSDEPPTLPEIETKPKPGKLKHNLKINVGALLPGSAPPKISDLKSPVPSGSFDETDRVEVLHSVTKDRARVPLNRRPSTRKGRKAALKSSLSDFKLDEEEKSVGGSTEIAKTSEENSKPERISRGKDFLFDEDDSTGNAIFAEVTSDSLFGKIEGKSQFTDNLFGDSPSLFGVKIDENDLFGPSPDVLGQVQDTKLTLSKTGETPQVSLLTEPAELDSDDLFKSTNVPPKLDSQSKSSIFDDEDDDDLFVSKKPIKTNPKKSLFDDEENEDDDDDIFKSFSSANVKTTESKMAAEKKIPKIQKTVKKLENTKPDDDPLSALLK